MTQSTDNLSKLHLRLWLKTMRLSRGIEAKLRENFKNEFNTTLPRFDVMAALARYEAGLKMSELSAVLRVSNGNITGIIDRLENDQLVTRVPIASDRRAFIVRLTPKGQQEFTRQAEAHEQWIHDLLSPVTADNYQDFLAAVENVNQHIFAPKADTADDNTDDNTTVKEEQSC